MTSKKIVLTKLELEISVAAGKQIRQESINRGLNGNSTVRKNEREQIHIEGCISEHAVCKFLNIPYIPKINVEKHIPDVGAVQVRSSRYRQCHLICDARDNPDQPFVCVFIDYNYDCYLLGWAYGREVVRQKYIKNSNYWMPQGDLRDIDSLIDINNYLMEIQ